MRLLLDTHVLLWFQADDPQLTGPARSAVLEPTNRFDPALVIRMAKIREEPKCKQLRDEVMEYGG